MLYDDINFNRQSQLFSKYTTESWDHHVGLCESNPNTLVTEEILRLMMTSIAQTPSITLSHAVTVSPLKDARVDYDSISISTLNHNTSGRGSVDDSLN